MRKKSSFLFLALSAALLGLATGGMATLSFARTPIVAAAITEAPQLVSPSDGSTLFTLKPTLEWVIPPSTTQYHLQVTPINNDGPGANLIIGSPGTTFTVPAPPDWYGMLPDMTYTWRVRVSDATVGLTEADSQWGPWSSQWSFRTRKTSSDTVSLVSPAGGVQVSGPTPVLTWSNSDRSIFYYEVQVSKDPEFGPNAFLYWELRHGGVTIPPNSYIIPSNFPLEEGTTYSWRVRPRVQGDGTPLPWAPAASFKTPAAGALFLEVTAPASESTVNTTPVQVTGKTKAGAIVTVNQSVATVDASGNFSASVDLVEGPNAIYIIASDAAGNVLTATLVVIYVP